MNAHLEAQQALLTETQPEQQSIEPLRYVALRLHGIHPQDQKWILHHLPSDSQRALRALLQELKSLGIPANLTPATVLKQSEIQTNQLETENAALFQSNDVAQFERLTALVLAAQHKAFSAVKFIHQLNDAQQSETIAQVGQLFNAVHAHLKPAQWVFVLAHNAQWSSQWMMRLPMQQQMEVQKLAKHIELNMHDAGLAQQYAMQAFVVWRMLLGVVCRKLNPH